MGNPGETKTTADIYINPETKRVAVEQHAREELASFLIEPIDFLDPLVPFLEILELNPEGYNDNEIGIHLVRVGDTVFCYSGSNSFGQDVMSIGFAEHVLAFQPTWDGTIVSTSNGHSHILKSDGAEKSLGINHFKDNPIESEKCSDPIECIREEEIILVGALKNSLS